MAGAVVKQQVAGETVVGVVDWRGHLALHIRQLVLGQPQIRIAVSVDVAGGHDHRVEDFFRRSPSEPNFAMERPIQLPLDQINAIVSAGHNIHHAIAGQVLKRDVEHNFVELRAERFCLEAPLAVVAIDAIFTAHDDLDHAVVVEVVQDERVDEDVAVVGRDVLAAGRVERRRTGAFEPLEPGEVDAIRLGQGLRREFGWLPLHTNVAAQDATLGQGAVDEVQRNPKDRRWPAIGVRVEAAMPPFALLE